MLAVVGPEAGAATVTSWAAPAVLASSLARVVGHPVAAGCGAALGGGVVACRFGLGAAEAGGGISLGGGVVAVGAVGVIASAAGFTDAGGAGATAGSLPGVTAGFTGGAHAPARKAIPSAGAAAVPWKLQGHTGGGSKPGAAVLPVVGGDDHLSGGRPPGRGPRGGALPIAARRAGPPGLPAGACRGRPAESCERRPSPGLRVPAHGGPGAARLEAGGLAR